MNIASIFFFLKSVYNTKSSLISSIRNCRSHKAVYYNKELHDLNCSAQNYVPWITLFLLLFIIFIPDFCKSALFMSAAEQCILVLNSLVYNLLVNFSSNSSFYTTKPATEAKLTH